MELIEKFKRMVSCDPRIDRECNCEDYFEIGRDKFKPVFKKIRICRKRIK